VHARLTNDGALMTRWFTPADALFWGTAGSSIEQTLGAARKTFMGDLLPKNATGTGNKIRSDAQVHMLVLGDVDDQTGGTSGQQFLTYFNNVDNLGTCSRRW